MQVVILCGGRGTRSYPFSEYFPKVMMPICGIPILVHLMRIYAGQGLKDFVLAAGYRKEILFDYFEGRFQDWRIKIIDTGENSDTGERIRRCLPHVSGRFFATYGDGLGNVDLGALAAFHQECGGLATVTSVPLRSQYGALVFDESLKVRSFVEKPLIPDCWINAGFFVFEKGAFEQGNGQNLESDVLPMLASHGALYAYSHRGFWKSLDTTKDHQEMERIHQGGSLPWMDVHADATAHQAYQPLVLPSGQTEPAPKFMTATNQY